MPTRREMLAAAAAVAAARITLAQAGERAGKTRIGICTFSCHQHWNAVRRKEAGTKFADGPGFYDYGRSLGAEGVQTSVASLDEAQARALQRHVADTGGC